MSEKEVKKQNTLKIYDSNCLKGQAGHNLETLLTCGFFQSQRFITPFQIKYPLRTILSLVSYMV